MAKLSRDAEFTAFVTSRSGWLRKVAYLLCADSHRADDLVQESVTKLYVNWHRAQRADNLDGYARVVLVNTFLAEQRTAWWRRTARGRRWWTASRNSAASWRHPWTYDGRSPRCRPGSGPPWCSATTAT
ncbi:sigma factor [Kitasatospora gansuensis]